jgi:hypothetical protein
VRSGVDDDEQQVTLAGNFTVYEDATRAFSCTSGHLAHGRLERECVAGTSLTPEARSIETTKERKLSLVALVSEDR